MCRRAIFPPGAWFAGGGALASGGKGLHRRRALPRTPGGRPAAVLLIAAEKAISALAAGGGAVLALVLRVHHSTDPLRLLFPREMAEAPRDIFVRWLARHLPHFGPRFIVVVGLGLAFWAVLLAAEAVGVWFDLGWGEFLIIVETVAFLPVELYAIVRKPHPSGFISLTVNLLILWYVASLYRRRLRAREAGASLMRTAFSAHVLYGAPHRTVPLPRGTAATPPARGPWPRREAAAAAEGPRPGAPGAGGAGRTGTGGAPGPEEP